MKIKYTLMSSCNCQGYFSMYKCLCGEMIETHPTEKVGVGLCLPEEGLVLCHGVLV